MPCDILDHAVNVSIIKPSMNDRSDLTNIRLRKFSISSCCSTVILLSGTC